MKKRSGSAVQPRARSRSLRYFIGIILLLTAVAACTQGATGLDAAQEAAFRELKQIAAVSAQSLNVYMDARFTDMLVAAKLGGPLRDSLAVPDARGDANGILEEWLKISGAYEAILLLDKNGVCLAAAPATLLNQDFSNDLAFKGAVEGRATVTDAHKSQVLRALDPESGGWTVTIAAPVNIQNQPAGVLLAFLKWSRVEELLTSVKVGSTGYVFALDRDNRAIVHPAGKIMYGRSVRTAPINLRELDDAVRNRAPHTRYEYTNPATDKADTRLVGLAYPKGYGNFPGLGWTVGAGADKDDLLSSGPPWWFLWIFTRGRPDVER